MTSQTTIGGNALRRLVQAMGELGSRRGSEAAPPGRAVSRSSRACSCRVADERRLRRRDVGIGSPSLGRGSVLPFDHDDRRRVCALPPRPLPTCASRRVHPPRPELRPDRARDPRGERPRVRADRLVRSRPGGRPGRRDSSRSDEHAVAARGEELVQVDAVRAVRLLREQVALDDARQLARTRGRSPARRCGPSRTTRNRKTLLGGRLRERPRVLDAGSAGSPDRDDATTTTTQRDRRPAPRADARRRAGRARRAASAVTSTAAARPQARQRRRSARSRAPSSPASRRPTRRRRRRPTAAACSTERAHEERDEAIDDQHLVRGPDEHEQAHPEPGERANVATDGRRIARDSTTAQPAKAAANSASLASPWKRMP